MFNFFKRSSKSRNDQKQRDKKNNACANKNNKSFDDNNSNKVVVDKNNRPENSEKQQQDAQLLLEESQYENDSVGERALFAYPTPSTASASSTIKSNSFFDIMAKGKNRRSSNNKNNNNSKQVQQQLQQQPHQNDQNNKLNLKAPETIFKSVDDDLSNSKKYAIYEKPVPKNENTIFEKIDVVNLKQHFNADDFQVKNNADKLFNDQPPEQHNSEKENKENFIVDHNIKENVNKRDCVHMLDEVRHKDENSQQKQYNECEYNDNDDQNDDHNNLNVVEAVSSDFVKEIIFEKYKRPVSPIFVPSVAVEFKSTISNDDDVDHHSNSSQQNRQADFVEAMGQQPTKSQNHFSTDTTFGKSISSIAHPSNPFEIPQTFTKSASSSPPTSSPSDKDIFYEADDNINIVPDDPTDHIFNSIDLPNENIDETNFLINIPVVVLSESFDNLENYESFENFENQENRQNINVLQISDDDDDEDDEDDDVENSENDLCVKCVPTTVSDVLTTTASTNKYVAGDHNKHQMSYDKIVINNDANLSDIQENLHKQHLRIDNHDHDSPDSGIDVSVNDDHIIDEISANEILNKLENKTNNFINYSVSDSEEKNAFNVVTNSLNSINEEEENDDDDDENVDDNKECKNGDDDDDSTSSSNSFLLENSNNSDDTDNTDTDDDRYDDDIDKRFYTIHSSVSEKYNLHSILSSDKKKSEKRIKKSVTFEDTNKSLPDIVESIANSMGLPLSSDAVADSATNQENDENHFSSSNQPLLDKSGTQILIETKIGNEMRDLVNQEARYSAQLEEAEKQVLNSQAKANDLACKIDELERNLNAKTWNVERLQSELQAAYKEGECVKKKLKLQESELCTLRTKVTETEEELSTRYSELERKYAELLEKLAQVQKLAQSLQLQLAEAQCAAADLRKEKEQCIADQAIARQKLQDALDAAILERTKMDTKWQSDFEQLRTVNSDREEHLLQDCEWKLRTTEQRCKAKVVAAETAKEDALRKATEIETEAKRQIDEVKHLKSYEAEVAQLRGLTNDQNASVNSMTQQLTELKMELEDANRTVQESIQTVRKIKFQCEQEVSDKHRQMLYRIDEARGEVAVMWEDRLMEEMTRLKIELESCYAEDRTEALQTAHAESVEEITKLTNKFNESEKELRDEIAELKQIIIQQNAKLLEANNRSDSQIMQIRVILDRSEREHQREMNAEIAKREEYAESIHKDHERDKGEMEEKFRERLQHVTDEFAIELTNNKEELQARHKKKIEQQYEKLMSEKEEAIQNLERTYKRKLVDAETKLRDLEISHHRDIKDLKNSHSMERSSLEQRDLQNSQEIETLHRKCRCLTKLFEEMRMRYERRDPRPEDVQEIKELRNHVETQDRDLRKLTEKLRELQMAQQNGQSGGGRKQPQQQSQQPQKNKKSNKIDVIYEENEDRESPPTNGFAIPANHSNECEL